MTSMTRSEIGISGYAIVSDDDKIAASDGLTPVSMRNDKDWEYYQGALDKADLVVMARRSHEAEPNVRNHRRLVLSRAAAGLEHRPDAWWWDQERVPWQKVATQLLPSGGIVAVSGGQVAFDLFLTIGFAEFHMSRAHGVTLPGGRGVFSACDAGLKAETVLSQAGLHLAERIPLDPLQGVEMNVWRRS
jgi:hypothetical protein